MNARGDKLKQN